MMNMRNLVWLVLLGGLQLWAQAPELEWHKGFGTNKEEHVHEGWQTSDGGFIGIGQNEENNGSRTNILVVKADSQGTQQWITQLGTVNEWDVGVCVHETTGGFIIGGGLYNPDTDRQERMLSKLDQHGEVVWQKTYGGDKASAVRGIDINEEGEIIATGYTDCADYGFVFIAEEADGFVMKTDGAGELIWDKHLTVPQGTKVRLEKNGGLAIVSTQWTYSGGRDHQDVVLLRTDTEGNEIFKEFYGAEYNDQCFDFDLTMDGGYILAGHTRSYGVVNWDYLLLKIDSTGKEEWVRTFGQPRGYDPRWIHDESYGVRSTPDGGYVIAGGSGDEYAYSERGHPSGSSNEWKAYLVKTDGSGNLLWEAVYPPTSVGNNAAEYVALTVDGGYIVFTDTDSQSPPEPNNFGFLKIEPDTVTFSNYYKLTLTIEGEGEVYPRNRYHLKDSILTLTATPGEGWEFLSWSGDVTGSENPVSITPGDDISIHASFQSTVGVTEVHRNSFRVYPNPATNGLVTITSTEPLDDAILSLYDMSGRELIRKHVNVSGSQEISLELEHTLNGLYTLRVSSNSNTTYSRLMVQ